MTLSSGQRDDGEQGEEDHITSTENAIGGLGDDRLVGYSAVNVLVGSAGKDKLTGRGEPICSAADPATTGQGRLPRVPDLPPVL